MPGGDTLTRPQATAYLFVAGTAALLSAPFLTWFSYGPFSLPFPSQVSLIWLLERGYWPAPVFYLSGVAAALLATGMFRRPLAFVGVLPAAFPVFILVVTLSTFFNGSMGYAQAVTVGMFTALLGSVLLESSYFAYRWNLAKPLAPSQRRAGGFLKRGIADPAEAAHVRLQETTWSAKAMKAPL